MNLITSIPDGINKEDVIFSLPYNLNRKSKKVNGHFVFGNGEIRIYLDNKLDKEFKFADFDEIVCEQLIGCSMLIGKRDSHEFYLCAFDQSLFCRYAELCKILEYYKRTGELITDTGDDEPCCPKCGVPLNNSTTCVFCAKKVDVFTRLVSMVGKYKAYFFTAIIATMLIEISWLVLPYIQRIIVDEYILPQTDDMPGFLKLCSILLVIAVFCWIVDMIGIRANFKTSLSVGRDLKQMIFAKAQQLSTASVSKRSAGEIINRISRDADRLQTFLTDSGREGIIKFLSLVVLGVTLFVMNAKLALLIIIPIPLVCFILSKVVKTLNIRYGKLWRMSNRYSSLLHDILNGIRVVKAYGNEKREIAKYTEASKNWVNSTINAEVSWYKILPFAQFLMSIGSFLILYFGGKMVLGEELSLGQLIQYTTYANMLYGPLEWMLWLPRLISDTSVSASRVFEILDERIEVPDSQNSVNLDIKGDIKFDDVYFGYKLYTPVLKGVSCEIKQGEMIGIVGHSGVGKSTMINLILRLYDCTSGSIKIDGVNIKDISQKSLREQVGVVLQETFLFNGSVFENIAYSKPDADFTEIIQAAKIANAHDFIVKLPDGYNTRVGEKGFSLSGGERQRVAIARAILHNPRILILDEATASLDTQTEKQIQDALDRLIKGRTTIAIAHRLSTLSHADKLIVLDKGKLAEMGSHDELMKLGGVYYKLVMAQRQTAKIKNAPAVAITEKT